MIVVYVYEIASALQLLEDVLCTVAESVKDDEWMYFGGTGNVIDEIMCKICSV